MKIKFEKGFSATKKVYGAAYWLRYHADRPTVMGLGVMRGRYTSFRLVLGVR